VAGECVQRQYLPQFYEFRIGGHQPGTSLQGEFGRESVGIAQAVLPTAHGFAGVALSEPIDNIGLRGVDEQLFCGYNTSRCRSHDEYRLYPPEAEGHWRTS
jgi:hypothetical protein